MRRKGYRKIRYNRKFTKSFTSVQYLIGHTMMIYE